MRRPIVMMAGLAMLALPQAGMAKEGTGSITCVHRSFAGEQGPVLVELARNGLEANNTQERELQRRIGARVEGCRLQNSWSKPERNAAIEYFLSRVLIEDALVGLKDFGVDEALLDGTIAKLDQAQRQALAEGQMSGALGSTMARDMLESGAQMGELTPERVALFGPLLAQGATSAASIEAAIALFDQ